MNISSLPYCGLSLDRTAGHNVREMEGMTVCGGEKLSGRLTSATTALITYAKINKKYHYRKKQRAQLLLDYPANAGLLP